MNNLEGKLVAGKAKPLGRYSHIKRAGDFLIVSGTSSRRADDSIAGASVDSEGIVQLDIRAQTKAVLENVRDILRSSGAGLEDVVEVTTYLIDMKDFPGYNEVYGQYFGQSAPARTTIAVHQLPHPHLLIEIRTLAYKPENTV